VVAELVGEARGERIGAERYRREDPRGDAFGQTTAGGGGVDRARLHERDCATPHGSRAGGGAQAAPDGAGAASVVGVSYCGELRLGEEPVDRHDRVEEQLARVPLFEGLSNKELRLVAQLSTYLEEPAGTVLTREGEAGHEFIIVLDGEVEVRSADQVIATRGPGTYVGEISLLEDRPRTATVVAKTPVKIEVIGQREFAGLLQEVPEISQKILPAMARRLAALEAENEAS
jgi:hypothetical protein